MSKKQLLFVVFFLGTMRLAAHEYPATEVRAVWLTTNYGLDWPHNRTDIVAQKRELISILDDLKKYHFNTVFFQTRARGEVFYRSKVEPMSSVIAGGGDDAFDPLAFAVEECHKRGMECHAWLVTYPLGKNSFVKSLGANSVTKKNPSIAKQFKGEWFLDPGNPNTDTYLLSMVKEIVSNYDVDGIQFDYVRYPDNKGSFPDADSYRLYGRGRKSLDDWRRDNITRFVTSAYDWVKSVKPWVQVSSSPLGRYREIDGRGKGWTAYETVYQDAGRWLQMGKHDALYPMMYYKGALFFPYADDWQANANKRIVAPGLGAFQMLELDWAKQDIVDQIDYTRRKKMSGQAFFRAQNILSNTKGILFTLNDYYNFPAKLPPMTWLSDSIPGTVDDLRAEKVRGHFQLKWNVDNGENERITFNVYRCETDDFDTSKGENLLAVGL
ncbi:MAG: family 10 glycosylhydrolase, partial [Dysgonamonadaceae bacterium]|nr:family 10 glycosylhydrolase [Dysgonamonadaceae bacterium]